MQKQCKNVPKYPHTKMTKSTDINMYGIPLIND